MPGVLRTTTPAQVAMILELSKRIPPPKISLQLGLSRSCVYWHLKKAVPKNMKLTEYRYMPGMYGKPLATLPQLIVILEEHFGRPLHMRSVSEFAKERLIRGISLEIFRRFTDLAADDIPLSFGIGVIRGRELAAYAKAKDPATIDFLTQKISAIYDSGE